MNLVPGYDFAACAVGRKVNAPEVVQDSLTEVPNVIVGRRNIESPVGVENPSAAAGRTRETVHNSLIVAIGHVVVSERHVVPDQEHDSAGAWKHSAISLENVILHGAELGDIRVVFRAGSNRSHDDP